MDSNGQLLQNVTSEKSAEQCEKRQSKGETAIQTEEKRNRQQRVMKRF